MSLDPTLVEKLKELPPDKQQELLEFVKCTQLKADQGQVKNQQSDSMENSSTRTPEDTKWFLNLANDTALRIMYGGLSQTVGEAALKEQAKHRGFSEQECQTALQKAFYYNK